MTIAVTSVAAEQIALNNIAIPNGWPFFYMHDPEGIGELAPDILYLHGCYVQDYADWQRMRQMVGDVPKVIVRWTGSDALQAQHFYEQGERTFFDWLNSDRFVHVPPNEAVGKELNEWVGLNVTLPLNSPASTLYEHLPKPEKFTVGVYMPPFRQDFFNMPMTRQSLKQVKDCKVIFYHWLPLTDKIEYKGPHELRYGLAREEYEKVIADCSCLFRIPCHDANSISAAEFLMAGRPVVSSRDLPDWPAKVNEEMEAADIAKVLEGVQANGDVPEEVSALYRDLYDPIKFKERLEARCQTKWPGVKLS